MTKKIKELTKEEMDKICAFHQEKGAGCLNDYKQNIKCPLYYGGGICLKSFIEMMKIVEKETEINEQGNGRK